MNGPNASYDSAAFRKEMEATAAQPGKVVRNDGDADAALKSAAKTVSAQYYVPHLAHASMEPPSATVHVAGAANAWRSQRRRARAAVATTSPRCWGFRSRTSR